MRAKKEKQSVGVQEMLEKKCLNDKLEPNLHLTNFAEETAHIPIGKNFKSSSEIPICDQFLNSFGIFKICLLLGGVGCSAGAPLPPPPKLTDLTGEEELLTGKVECVDSVAGFTVAASVTRFIKE